jgi:YaiO family outer membrane protein
MKKCISFIFIAILWWPALIYAAGEAQTEQLLRAPIPRPEVVPEEKAKEKGEFFWDSYYEGSKVIQGSRPGRWREITNRIGYKYRNIQAYGTISQWNRFSVNNYTANFGAYINFPNSYAHIEGGWGWDITYMYKLQSIIEYGHRLHKNLFWQVGYNYRDYSENDTHMVYPGLIYYFGDNYISVDYGLSLTESRGTAQFGTVKGNFALTKRLALSLGAAVGERLYDIFELPSRDQPGYIVFGGLNFNVCPWAIVRVGYSYGTEKPDFIKRSINTSLSLKF